jgi:hypothetical protein
MQRSVIKVRSNAHYIRREHLVKEFTEHDDETLLFNPLDPSFIGIVLLPLYPCIYIVSSQHCTHSSIESVNKSCEPEGR